MSPAEELNKSMSILVRSDKLQLLYRQSYPAIFVSMLTAIVLAGILWPIQESSVLITWLSVMFLTSVIRYYLFRRYHRVLPVGDAILKWELPYLMTLTLTTLTWGIGCLFIMPYDSPLHQAIIVSFLIGLSGGAISFYSSHTEMTLITIIILVLPISIYFLINGDYAFIGLAIGALGFFMSSVRASRFLGKTLEQNFEMKHQLEHSQKEAERHARYDYLTALYNRRAFYEYANIVIASAKRAEKPVSIILLDVDHFKSINDTYGHAAGDEVLKQIADIMKHRFRESDIIARIGGEEFAILLPDTTLPQAVQLAETLRLAIGQTAFTFKGAAYTVTGSFGVSSDSYDIDVLISQSDALMYQSKKSGRNTVSSLINKTA